MRYVAVHECREHNEGKERGASLRICGLSRVLTGQESGGQPTSERLLVWADSYTSSERLLER